MIYLTKSRFKYLTSGGSVNGQSLAWFEITSSGPDKDGAHTIKDLASGQNWSAFIGLNVVRLEPQFSATDQELREYQNAFNPQEAIQTSLDMDYNGQTTIFGGKE